MNPINRIQTDLEPYREALLNHPVYDLIRTLGDLNIFLEHHIFAVWDFMSLLKALQRELTCVEVPWAPKGSPNVRRLINELVLAKESDLDPNGEPTSHFELYLDAMEATDADTSSIKDLLRSISFGHGVSEALEELCIPDSVRDFVLLSSDTIHSGRTHEIAALFTFGQDDLLPDLLRHQVEELDEHCPDRLEPLLYYLDRLQEVSGREHRSRTMLIMAELCGEDSTKWEECRQVAERALEKRLLMWDGMAESILRRRQDMATYL